MVGGWWGVGVGGLLGRGWEGGEQGSWVGSGWYSTDALQTLYRFGRLRQTGQSTLMTLMFLDAILVMLTRFYGNLVC